MLNAFGFGASWQTFSVNNLDNLYAGALRQFTTGRMGWSSLWILIKPFIEGAEGFMLVYFHLCSLGIRVVLFLIVSLICFLSNLKMKKIFSRPAYWFTFYKNVT